MPAAAAFAWVLPVSGCRVALRQPTGRDEMLLLEVQGTEPARAIALLDALADGTLDTSALPVTDIDALLLLLRRALLGDRIVTDTVCPAPGCGAPVDVAFGIGAFLGHHAPRAPRLRSWRVTPCAAQPGWFALLPVAVEAEVVRFRLPTIGDERDAAGAAALAGRCIAPASAPRAVRRAAEAAMAALAPSLAGPLDGACPHCGTQVPIRFDPRRYVLAELSDRAGFVAEEMDALAARYHWSEHSILDLPSPRRTAYAEMARRAAA